MVNLKPWLEAAIFIFIVIFTFGTFAPFGEWVGWLAVIFVFAIDYIRSWEKYSEIREKGLSTSEKMSIAGAGSAFILGFLSFIGIISGAIWMLIYAIIGIIVYVLWSVIWRK